MKFTLAALATAFMAAGATAAPGATEARQAGFVRIRFYGQGGCQGDGILDRVFFDDGSGDCQPQTIDAPYLSWAVVDNESSRPLSLYTRNDCTTLDGGNIITVPPFHEQCYTQDIGSVDFHD